MLKAARNVFCTQWLYKCIHIVPVHMNVSTEMIESVATQCDSPQKMCQSVKKKCIHTNSEWTKKRRTDWKKKKKSSRATKVKLLVFFVSLSALLKHSSTFRIRIWVEISHWAVEFDAVAAVDVCCMQCIGLVVYNVVFLHGFVLLLPILLSIEESASNVHSLRSRSLGYLIVPIFFSFYFFFFSSVFLSSFTIYVPLLFISIFVFAVYFIVFCLVYFRTTALPTIIKSFLFWWSIFISDFTA